MPPIANGPAGRGLHLGWIPNEPGRRPRDYPQAPPTAAGPDPAKLRRVQDGQHWSGLRRVLVVAGVLALILLGGIGVASHKALFWEVAVGLAVASWLGTIISAWSHRRAVRALDKDQAQAAERHGQALEAHAAAVSAWAEAEAERVAGAPHWLRVSSPDSASRLDVFGGSVRGRSGMLAGVGGSLLERHAVIVLDLSAERVCDGLIAAAEAAGLSYHDYQLPRDLRLTPLLGGLPGEQVASQIVEVMHADDPTATAAGRATDLMVLRKIIAAVRVAGTGSPGPADGDGDITMRHLHEALACVLAGSPVAAGPGRPGPPGPATALGQDAVAALAAQFPGEFRREVAASLIRLAAVVEPLRDLGADAAPRPPARLTCLSLEEGPRDVASDLTAAFVVQWATQAIL
ncbi:MAG TPA: hypothetical protein VH478_26570, partial [Trebonia sp.]|nr:hypothetical protein [Trebonia sp.]